ncbi:MAG: acylglycerol kinase family protein, partial [Novosphingobium sp.]
MNTWLFVNAASGSNNDEAVRAVIQAFTDAGAALQRVVDVSESGPPHQDELVRAGVGRLAVFAGDGTTNAVVTALEGWDGQVLVLPGGTANLLARTLHGERDAAAIISALPQLRPVRRPCIRTSQGTALIEVLAGPGATWSDVREVLRDGDLPGVAASSLEAIRQSTSGPMVAVSDPAIGRPEGYSGVRLEPAAGGMLVEGYGADTVA